ncbi:MAG: hypothetical protein IKQ94_09380 [Bacteroidales bacterium]|nr:hypothetical protein [Bacteroidales bacterium]
MNRIILIGNGFDLAHGLKTSYADFIDWYWEKMGLTILKESSKNIVSDELCSFTLQPSKFYFTWFQFWSGHYIKKDNPFNPWEGKEVVKIAKENKSLCQFKYKSDFFEQINKYYEKGWVDIENEYYTQLLISLKNEYTFSKYTNNPAKLNNELSFIQEKLIEYLKEVQGGISKNMVIDEIRQKMKAEFSVQDISVNFKKQFLEARKKFWGSLGKETPYTPQRTFVLNFNYTTLADLYFKEVTHIHGNINEPASVIFGYGDELDEKYKTIVNKNENEYLRNVKSVKYLEHANYRNMLEFIESAPFQIFIMGHSCGNSDRTLLNTLFEHRNCVSIKPFYYIKDDGSDNYIELVQNISRNFTDMKLMRNRVVNKKFCEPLLSKDTTQSTGEESK